MTLQNLSERKQYFYDHILTSPISRRKEILRNMKKWIITNQDFIVGALATDLGKSRPESLISEIKPTLNEISFAIKNLNHWSKAERVPASLPLLGTKSYIYYEPKGICLVIAPWNFPFLLTLGPVISALAAGNGVIIKPSEFTEATSKVIAKMMQDLFDEREVKVVHGDASVSQNLISLPFDHIFFTGSPQVGKIVMGAASKNLSSVTLELGGCNLAVITDKANVKDSAQKIAWGKLLNCGQACIAPNMLFVHQSKLEKFQKELIKQIEILNTGTGKIVNTKHFKRIKELFDSSKQYGSKTTYCP